VGKGIKTTAQHLSPWATSLKKMQVEETGGGDSTLRETRVLNLCFQDRACDPMPFVRFSLIGLGVIYATIAVVLMLMQVSLYMPDIQDVQSRQGSLLEAMARDLSLTKKDVSDMTSDAFDTNYQMTLLSMKQTPLLETLLQINKLELNATLSLIKLFT
jgi:hypothetical protein